MRQGRRPAQDIIEPGQRGGRTHVVVPESHRLVDSYDSLDAVHEAADDGDVAEPVDLTGKRHEAGQHGDLDRAWIHPQGADEHVVDHLAPNIRIGADAIEVGDDGPVGQGSGGLRS